MSTLWLGHRWDPASATATDERVRLKAHDLTRHAVCLGMTGSGKTGLVIGLLEEVALSGVPILAIDPKGDLTNLALAFPDLDGPSFAAWVDPGEAARKGVSVEALGEASAATWRAGLTRAGDDLANVGALASRTQVTIYTPGSRTGRPIDVLAALAAPPAGLQHDDEGRAAYAVGAATALLGLVGPTRDALRDPEAILVVQLLEHAWGQGRSLPLEALLPAIVDPPFATLGVFALDTFFPRAKRLDLALRLNTLLASPAFASWREGDPLDVDAWLQPVVDGRTPVSVLYLAHLDDAQRMFFVTLLLHAVVAWSRRQPGTGSLRAVLAFDEVLGFLPPHPNDPPSKGPMLTLLKQSRAVGLGVVLATQNPVDVDYKALSNAGTWMVGRMQTEQDRRKVVDGLCSAAGELDPATVNGLITQLPERTFVVRTPDGDGAQCLAARFVRVFLRGPLTRSEVSRLNATSPLPASGSSTPAVTATSAAIGLPCAPPLPPGFDARWLHPAAAHGPLLADRTRPRLHDRPSDGSTLFEPAVQMHLRLRFELPDGSQEEREEHRTIYPLDEDVSTDVVFDEDAFDDLAPDGARYLPLPPALDEAQELDKLRIRVLADAVREEVTTAWRHTLLKLSSRAGESAEAFAARVRAASEVRLAEAAGALHRKAEAQAERLRDAVDKAEADAARHDGDASAHRTEQVVSVGQTLLGLFMGRSRSLSGAVSKQRQVTRANERAERARSAVEAAQDRLDDLQHETAQALGELEAEHEARVGAVTSFDVRVKRSDATVDDFRILWVPVTRVV